MSQLAALSAIRVVNLLVLSVDGEVTLQVHLMMLSYTF